MNDFVNELASLITGFPPVLLVLLAPPCGSISAAIIAGLVGTITTPKQFLGQFIVGWLFGAFGGGLIGPVFKAPAYTVGYFAGLGGYWGARTFIKKKQDEFITKPPGVDPPAPTA